MIELVVPREESIARLSLRAAEQGRTDDTEEVIAEPARDLRARDGADPRRLPRAAGSSTRSTASARSTRSPSAIIAALEARGLVRSAAA